MDSLSVLEIITCSFNGLYGFPSQSIPHLKGNHAMIFSSVVCFFFTAIHNRTSISPGLHISTSHKNYVPKAIVFSLKSFP